MLRRRSTTTAPSGRGARTLRSAGGKTWTQLIRRPDRHRSAAGEDLLPLFPVLYTDRDRQRRIYVGLVPTSSGETFKAAGALSPLAPGRRLDRRAAGRSRARGAPGEGDGPAPGALARADDGAARRHRPRQGEAIAQAEADQLVQASRFLLVDFAEFLVTDMSPIWECAEREAATELTPAAAALYDALDGRSADTAPPSTWRDALDRRLDRTPADPVRRRSGLAARGAQPRRLGPVRRRTRRRSSAWFSAHPLPPERRHRRQATSIQGDAVGPAAGPEARRSQGQWHVRDPLRLPAAAVRPLAARRDLGEPSERVPDRGLLRPRCPGTADPRSRCRSTPASRDLRKLRKNVNFLHLQPAARAR